MGMMERVGRMRRWWRHGGASRSWMAAAFALAAGSCGSNTPIDLQDDPAVAPFVGDWSATELVLTNIANPDAEPLDVLENGGSFTINVQPSGTYTATLTYPDLPPFVEIGDLTVVASSLVLHPAGGEPAVSAFAFDGPDKVTLDGPTEFDFNLDGTPEEADAHIVLERS